ncbi:hypothetical protein CFAM422_008109 [Trichoderma lentiforme]|uniref:Uncharacterized protein n=1 Tax=Trichoderma lentiforme TaxID=1567552 RepID=A0A9P5CCS8_9HYPO|nr:hypothetical protein CFAM422_008109 [Trichoderma lentiforme]
MFGVIVSQHFNPRVNLRIHGRLNRLQQRHAVVWHCLKAKNSLHDHQDRVMLTKWARLLCPICSITGREDGDIAGQYCPGELDPLPCSAVTHDTGRHHENKAHLKQVKCDNIDHRSRPHRDGR